MFLCPVFAYNMVIGIFLARKGVLAQPSKHPGAVLKLLGVGFGLGLPLNLVALPIPKEVPFAPIYGTAIEMVFAVILSLGYLTLIAILVEKFKGKFWTPIAAVGRMALSNYLMQSILCTILFYSWGFGLYGKLNQMQLLYVVLGVWLFCLVFSVLWLRKRDIGPFEWVWRSWVAGQKLPWKTVTLTPPPVLQR